MTLAEGLQMTPEHVSRETRGLDALLSHGSILLALAASALLLVGCGGQAVEGGRSPAYTGAPRSEILEELEAYYADFSARDWDRFSDHFWPGATITTIWEPPGTEGERVVVTPVPEFVARAPRGPGSREIFEEELLSAKLRVSGPLAQAWARYSARFGDPGDVAEWEGTDAFTLMRHEGRWRIVSLVFASDE